MKRIIIVIAAAIIASFAFTSCGGKEITATKIIFEPESIELYCGETQRVEYGFNGTTLPSGRESAMVSFKGNQEMIELSIGGDGVIFVKGLKSGSTTLAATVEDDPKDAGIVGQLSITIK